MEIMTSFKKIQIPRPDGLDQSRLPEYHALLRNSVFPLVDELAEAGLIEGFDFLTHSALDLRLWIRDDADLAAVRQKLREAGFPNELVDFPPAETGAERTRLLEILMISAQTIRALIEDPSTQRTLSEPIHWILNQYGLHNVHEIDFHERLAAGWRQQLGLPPQQ
jgi:hypothetical protein